MEARMDRHCPSKPLTSAATIAKPTQQQQQTATTSVSSATLIRRSYTIQGLSSANPVTTVVPFDAAAKIMVPTMRNSVLRDELYTAIRNVYRRHVHYHAEKDLWAGGKGFYKPGQLYGGEHWGIVDSILNNPRIPGHNVLVDVGANEGAITAFAAARGAAVYAFEAHPLNQEMIAAAIWANGWQGQVHLIGAAVSDIANEYLYFPDFGGDCKDQCNGIVDASAKDNPADAVKNQEHMLRIVTTRIDAHVAEDVGLLKIDIEGFEEKGMLGASQLLTQHRVTFVHSEFSFMLLRGDGSGMNYLMMFAKLGYVVYLEDCSHNIDAETISMLKLVAVCPDAGSQHFVEKVISGNASQHVVAQSGFERFVDILSAASDRYRGTSVNCCMVNLLMYRPL